MRKKIVFAAAFFLLLAGFGPAMAQAKDKSDNKAQDFTLADLKGQKVSLSDFKNKPLALFFWTTWCPYCRKELKMLNSKYPELVKDGLQILAINVEETAPKVQAAVEKYNLSFKVLLDKEGSVSNLYGVFGVPTYIFIGKGGAIRFQGHSFPEDEYKGLITE